MPVVSSILRPSHRGKILLRIHPEVHHRHFKNSLDLCPCMAAGRKTFLPLQQHHTLILIPRLMFFHLLRLMLYLRKTHILVHGQRWVMRLSPRATIKHRALLIMPWKTETHCIRPTRGQCRLLALADTGGRLRGRKLLLKAPQARIVQGCRRDYQTGKGLVASY